MPKAKISRKRLQNQNKDFIQKALTRKIDSILAERETTAEINRIMADLDSDTETSKIGKEKEETPQRISQESPALSVELKAAILKTLGLPENSEDPIGDLNKRLWMSTGARPKQISRQREDITPVRLLQTAPENAEAPSPELAEKTSLKETITQNEKTQSPTETEIAWAIETLTEAFGTDFVIPEKKKAFSNEKNSQTQPAPETITKVKETNPFRENTEKMPCAETPIFNPRSPYLKESTPKAPGNEAGQDSPSTTLHAVSSSMKKAAGPILPKFQQESSSLSESQLEMRTEHVQDSSPNRPMRQEQRATNQSKLYRPLPSIPIPFCQFDEMKHQGQKMQNTSIFNHFNVLPADFEKLRLTGDNLLLWAQQVQVVLMKENVLFMLLDPPPKPWSLEIDNMHHKAFCILIMSIEPSLYPTISQGLTVTGVWEKLFSLFHSRSRTNTAIISREFYRAKLVKGMHVSEHLCKLNAMRADLIQRGEIISEQTLMSIIINSLDSSWDNFVSRMDCAEGEHLTVEILSRKLIAEDNLRRDRASLHRESRNVTKESGYCQVNQVNECYLCGSNTHFKRECPQNQYTKKTPTWVNQGKIDCNTRDFQSNRRGHIKDKLDNKKNNNVNIIEHAAIALTEVQKPHYWLVDSGASRHIVCDKRMFKVFKDMDSKVKVATGKSAKVAGIGTVHIQGLGDIEDILYVPEITYNLLSTLKLSKDGKFQITFKDGKGYVIYDDHSVGELEIIDELPYFVTKQSSKPIQDDPEIYHVKGKDNRSGTTYTKKGESYSKGNSNQEGENKRDKQKGIDIGKPLHDNCAHLLHRKLGHIGFPIVKKMTEFARGVNLKNCSNFLECSVCKSSKSKSQIKPKKSKRVTNHIFQLIHMDLVGPLKPSLGKKKYFLTLVDDHSRYGYVFSMKTKSETFSKFREFYNLIENQHNVKIKQIQTDRGTEFLSNDFQDWLKEKGIIHNKTPPYSAFANGVAERRNGVLQSMIRCVIEDAGVSIAYWAEALNYVNYTLNRLWSSVVQTTPYEIVYGRKPSLAHLKVFGTMADVHIPKEQRSKGDRTSRKLRFLGYEPGTKAYRFIDTDYNIHVSNSATFYENANWGKIHANEILINNNQEQENCEPDTQKENRTREDSIESEDSDIDSEPIQTKRKQILRDKNWRKGNSNQNQCESDDHSSSDESLAESIEVRRPIRSTRGKTPKRYQGYIASINQVSLTPNSYDDILKLDTDEQEKWNEAMKAELDSLRNLNVYSSTTLPEGKKLIGTRWVYKAKPLEGGKTLYKARLVAKGYAQRYPEDYTDIYSPTVRPETVKISLVTAAILNQQVYQFDVQTAYLHADLDKEIYVKAPPGPNSKEGEIWLLRKSLYGLRQSGKRWFDCLSKTLRHIGFSATTADQCAFVRKHQNEYEKVLIYVDDILFIGNSKERSDQFAQDLKKHFTLKSLGKIDKYLGVQISQTEKGFMFSQKEKIIELLLKCNMMDANTCETPMQTDFVKNMNIDAEEFGENTLYRSIIGSLLYISNWSRPDITLPVNLLSRHVQKPSKYHWNAVKRLLRYLKRTMDVTLLLEPDKSDVPKLTCYCDADWAADCKTRKSTSGYIVFLNNSPVYWYTGKQNLISTSTAEAEFVCLSKAANNLVWFDDLIESTWTQPIYPIIMLEDNSAAIEISKAEAIGHKSRHIDIKYKNVRQLAKMGFIDVIHVDTKEQIADILTKPLPKEQHYYLAKRMCLKFTEV